MEESNTKYQTERQKLLQAQTQALDPGPWTILGPWQDPNTLHYPEDNRKELPKVPQPQGNPKTSKETGANPKTTVTLAVWGNTTTNVIAQAS